MHLIHERQRDDIGDVVLEYIYCGGCAYDYLDDGNAAARQGYVVRGIVSTRRARAGI